MSFYHLLISHPLWFFFYIKVETPCSWICFYNPDRLRQGQRQTTLECFLFFLPWRTRSCYHRIWAGWTPQWQNRNEGQHRLFCCPLFSHHHQAGKQQGVGRWKMGNVNTKDVLTQSFIITGILTVNPPGTMSRNFIHWILTAPWKLYRDTQ